MRDWVRPLLGMWAIAVFLFLFAPIVAVVVFSFNSGRSLEIWDGAGLSAYTSFLSNGVMHSAIRTSIYAAIGSAMIATLFGSLAGIALARRPGKWQIIL